MPEYTKRELIRDTIYGGIQGTVVGLLLSVVLVSAYAAVIEPFMLIRKFLVLVMCGTVAGLIITLPFAYRYAKENQLSLMLISFRG